MSTELEQLAPAAPNAASPARRAAVKGRRKAAVLLISLGTERAAQVFKHLRDDEIEALSLEMAKLQRVDGRAMVEGRAGQVAAADTEIPQAVQPVSAPGPESSFDVAGHHAARRPERRLLPDRHGARHARRSTSPTGTCGSTAWSTTRSP